MSDNALCVVMAQLNLVVGDIAGNTQQVISASRKARVDYAADVIVFPELTLTGYPPEDLLKRASFLVRVERALGEIVAQLPPELVVIVGAPERDGDKLYNAAYVLQSNQTIFSYRKYHLPNYGVFDEKRYFSSVLSPSVFEVKGIKLAVCICEDLWFAEPAYYARQAGAEVIVSLNASPFDGGKSSERERMLKKRVAEVALPIIYTNLVGGQDELVFDGGSFVVSAQGEVVQRAANFCTGLYPVSLYRQDGKVAVRDGHVCAAESYEASVYNALVLGVRDYVTKNGFKGVVIGLSGGVDSALTLALAVDALGYEHVEAVMMPSRFTADMSLDDAQAEAKALGVEYRVLSIEQPFEAFLSVLKDELQPRRADATEENIQARCRGVMLMAISNRKGKIVLTTGNKSEMSVGYATLYGDMAGGFAPIKDIPKMLVYRLSHYRNGISAVIPERVLTRAPSAELAPDQKDEDSLPPYDILDPILKMYIEDDCDPDHIIAQGYEGDTVYRVVAMVNRNEYKRRQAPPGVKITQRAFGRDRRYPITSGYRYS